MSGRRSNLGGLAPEITALTAPRLAMTLRLRARLDENDLKAEEALDNAGRAIV